MNYNTLINKLFTVNLFGGMKLGLKNALSLHALLDYPANTFKTIHVAGSNGKGSVSTKVAKGLELSGLKVGLYTSPHISCFRERIQINGEMISEDDTALILDKIFKFNEIHPTFFEITTLLAFTYFAEQKVDVAVIEVGLGGKLDATNIITPILSIITSISLDHTDILGDTIEKITEEKAGIIKKNIPVIIGPNVPFDTILKIALERNASLTEVQGDFLSYEDENNAVAKQALESLNIEKNIIEQALKAKQPCRMEMIQHLGKTVVLDVAHNPDGLSRLFTDLKNRYGTQSFRIIFGLSQNKDIEECISVIKKEGSFFHLVAAKNGRAVPVLELKKHFEEAITHDSIADAVNNSLSFNEIIIICGTFFIMSEARSALNKKEPRDNTDMNERNVFKICD